MKSGAHAVFLGINSTHSPVKIESGFWLLVGAVASRLLSAVPVVFSSQSAKTEPVQQWISKSLRDTHNVDDVFYPNLTSKIASTIRRLRKAVQTYQDQEIIDEGCKRLFTRIRDDEELASLMPSHFYQQSAALFLGMHSEESGIPPGPLLYESCPYHGFTKAPESGSQGVYLVVVRECCHGGGLPINTPEYKRRESGEGFDEILLAEAIWQVVLQTSAQRNMSEFTQNLRERGSGNADLISNVWRGCNVNSALEEFKTGGWRNRRAD
ncbi:uncharacterized protein PAC_06340 [Phialocephala subalpina]|uniref:Uncharacterized protein n=1 Tax=Phialocephala subalpina TaxID=576137 RepID=A0A1L7WUK0_9HELO|nr:uncharacterized protein PAC_06340 [Phialocephala subalpina]